MAHQFDGFRACVGELLLTELVDVEDEFCHVNLFVVVSLVVHVLEDVVLQLLL